MKVKAITSKDQQLLDQVHRTLKAKWTNSKNHPQQSCKLFGEQIKKDPSEYIYAVLLNEQNEITIIGALFLEYKLTRGLSQIYHLQIQYKICNLEEELFFQSQIVQLIPGYKITGLNVTLSTYFPPHQVYMEIDLRAAARLKGSL